MRKLLSQLAIWYVMMAYRCSPLFKDRGRWWVQYPRDVCLCNLQRRKIKIIVKRKKSDKLKLICVYFSYLAETPLACEEKVSKLLDYMLSVEGEDEPRCSNFDSMVYELISFFPFWGGYSYGEWPQFKLILNGSPFYSICFMLPLLCQMTMKVEGCKLLVSCGGHKAVS